MQNSMESKILLLKQEIIDKHYDPTEFEQFCEEVKQQESDLENWTYIEIQELILMFQQSKLQNQSNLQQSQQQTTGLEDFEFNFDKVESAPSKFQSLFEMPAIQLVQTEVVAKNNKQMQILPNNQQSPVKTIENQANQSKESIQQPVVQKKEVNAQKSQEQSPSKDVIVVNCLKLGQKLLENIKDTIVITIGEATFQKNGSLFSTKTLFIQISTSPLGYNANRKYSDFTWIRKVLTQINPGIIIPVLPEECKNDDTTTLLKLRSQLQLFLNEIIMIYEVRNSQHFIDFLSGKELESIKKSSKKSIATQISSIMNSTGQIHINPRFVANVEDYNQYLKQNKATINSLKSEFNVLHEIYEKIINQHNQVCQKFRECHSIQADFESTTSSNIIMGTTIEKFTIEIENRKTFFSKELQALKSSFIFLLSYLKYGWKSLKELCKLVNKLNQTIEGKQIVIDLNQISSYLKSSNNDTSSFFQISTNHDKLILQYLYFNNILKEETKLFIERQSRIMKQELKKYITLEQVMLTEWMQKNTEFLKLI